jgi:hypothetical protein
MTHKISQEEIEALYSKRNIHLVLNNAIRCRLDEFLVNWALECYLIIPPWLDGTYYPSKMKRLQELASKTAAEGLESLVVAIAATALHTPEVQTIQQAVGYLQAFMPHVNPFHRATTAAELLALLSRRGDKGFFYIRRNGFHPATLEVNHWPFIDEHMGDTYEWINDTLFNPPLVEPPLEVKNNFHCGYHTISEPLLMGHLTMHEEPQNYEVINILNQIEWVLDEGVLNEPEVPSKPITDSEQHQVFSDMANDSQFIYRLLGKDPFWLAWQYDSRGRMYSHGYHVNFQSFEYKKALLSFNTYEYLSE